MVGNGIANGTQPQFVAGLAFLKQLHDPLGALPLSFVEIYPS